MATSKEQFFQSQFPEWPRGMGPALDPDMESTTQMYNQLERAVKRQQDVSRIRDLRLRYNEPRPPMFDRLSINPTDIWIAPGMHAMTESVGTTMTTTMKEEEVEIPDFTGEAKVPEAKLEAGLTEEYIELAEKLGVAQNSVKHALFARWLQKNEIPVYDISEVQRYLQERCDALEERHASRELFMGQYTWDWAFLSVKGCTGKAGTKGVYSETIPLQVLQIADRVMQFPDSKNFCWGVSKIKRDPDPFLAVNYFEKWFVLAHWDEPGFSIVKK